MSFRVSKLALPPVKTSGPVARYVPRRLVVPLANLSVPAPATLEALVSVETPPANSSVAAPPIVNAPLLVPPAARLSAPLCTSTVPRSEERRVGKECSSPSPAYAYNQAHRTLAEPPDNV